MKKIKTIPEQYSFIRYLEAKKNVDNRALNQRVWTQFTEALSRRDAIRIIEVGAGIGTMLERMLSANLFQQATYTGIDISPENIAYARARLPGWARTNGFQVYEDANGCFHLNRYPQVVSVHLTTADVLDYVGEAGNWQAYDLLIAHAFMDLVDIPQLLPQLFRLLEPDGLFYFTINYDGLTILEPPTAGDLDRKVLELYDQTMDERATRGLPSGDSQAGRHMFKQINHAGGQILAAGPSDWIVFAEEDGFTLDESYFLHFIIQTIYTALQNHPQLNLQAFSEWINTRHAQIDSSELIYIAHQIDFLGQK